MTYVRALFLASVAVLTGCGPVPFTTQMKGEAVVQGSPLGAFFNVFPQIGSFAGIDFDQNQDFKTNPLARLWTV